MTQPRHAAQPILGELNYRSRQAWVAAKNRLGLPRRGDKTFYVEHFSRLLRARAGDIDCGVTAHARDDGAGAQAQALMSAMAFAHAHGVHYVHRPFTSIAHAETDMPTWVRMCEAHFNLGAGEPHLDIRSAPVVAVEDLTALPPEQPIIAAAEHFMHYCNRDPDALERVQPLLRSKFWQNKTRERRPGELRIAIHMRRGDVTADDKKVANNFTPNATFVNTLARLQAMLAGKVPALSVEIFSQGDASMFADLAAMGAKLRLDAPALDTHRALVEADILVMSKGAFSYTTAVLNEGIVLYDPQKYRALRDWVVRAPDGSFGEAEVSARLAALFTRS